MSTREPLSPPRHLTSAAVLMAGCGGATTSHHQPASPSPTPTPAALNPRSRPARKPERPAARAMRRYRSSYPRHRRTADRRAVSGAVGGARPLRAHHAGARARRLPRDHPRRRLARLARPRHHARHPLVVSFDEATRVNPSGAAELTARLARRPRSRSRQRAPEGGLRAPRSAMPRDGWEVDAHTLTQSDLTTVGPARLEPKVAGSRAWLASLRGPRRVLRLSRRALRRARPGGGARRGLRRGDDDRGGHRVAAWRIPPPCRV